MRKVLDINLLNHYIVKHNIENIFDEDISKYTQLYFYQKEEFILEAESELEYYYLFVDGKIKVSYLFENGKSMFLKFYQEFNALGDLELLKNIPILCNVEAIEDTYVIAIPSDIIRLKYFDNVKFLHHLIDSLSEKFYATINNSSYNFVYPLINRLSSYLIEHLTDEEYIILNSSFEEISQFLGTTYRHLNRTLNKLCHEGILKKECGYYRIIDMNKLKFLEQFCIK